MENQSVYIKIDTQGWEQRVFKSGENFMSRHQKWLAKTEFAPMWLESQGTKPVDLLHYLLNRYRVYEYPARIPWNAKSLSSSLGEQLNQGCESAFVDYVRKLNRNGNGWVDLIVVPISITEITSNQQFASR